MFNEMMMRSALY